MLCSVVFAEVYIWILDVNSRIFIWGQEGPGSGRSPWDSELSFRNLGAEGGRLSIASGHAHCIPHPSHAGQPKRDTGHACGANNDSGAQRNEGTVPSKEVAELV